MFDIFNQQPLESAVIHSLDMKERSKIFVKTSLLISAFIFINSFVCAQQFINGDLEDEVNMGGVVPEGWDIVDSSFLFSQSSSNGSASPDLCNIDSPNPSAGLHGNPQSGESFITGLRAGAESQTRFDEGIQQSVSGFLVGSIYEITFHQTVVKQTNALDTTGFWRVFLDETIIGDSEPSHSLLPHVTTDLVWTEHKVIFVATANTHIIAFLPRDDDDDLALSSSNSHGALRMGLDNISISPTELMLSINDLSFCAGSCGNLEIVSNIEIANVEWDNGIFENNVQVVVCPELSTTYTAIVTAANGQVESITAAVEVFPVPVANFRTHPEQAEMLEEINFINQSTGATDWNWNLGNIDQSNNENVNHIFDEVGLFPVTLSVSNGICEDEITVNLHVTENVIVYIPNTFTPNEDGLNDILSPTVSGVDQEEYLFQIYNRNGEIVFETEDIQEHWNGVPVQGIQHYSIDGVYNWTVNLKEKSSSKRKEFKGYTLMVR